MTFVEGHKTKRQFAESLKTLEVAKLPMTHMGCMAWDGRRCSPKIQKTNILIKINDNLF